MEMAGPDAGHESHFSCALSLAWPDGHIESFEGRVDGLIVWPPRGTKGFGYDPIFQPIGRNQTFGEIEPDEKHAMSHRADAFSQLVDRKSTRLNSSHSCASRMPSFA